MRRFVSEKMRTKLFTTIDQGPTYLGQSIYEDNNQRVFQLEIGSSKERINEHLLYSFEALARISSYANTPYKLFVLIIHIDKYDIPIIARSKFTCCKAFYVDGTMTEKKWRDECLLMKVLWLIAESMDNIQHYLNIELHTEFWFDCIA